MRSRFPTDRTRTKVWQIGWTREAKKHLLDGRPHEEQELTYCATMNKLLKVAWDETETEHKAFVATVSSEGSERH